MPAQLDTEGALTKVGEGAGGERLAALLGRAPGVADMPPPAVAHNTTSRQLARLVNLQSILQSFAVATRRTNVLDVRVGVRSVAMRCRGRKKGRRRRGILAAFASCSRLFAGARSTLPLPLRRVPRGIP